ncbi:MAG: hypothetical protein KDC95_02670 [Planctomycetes bacterium]|nr:hypothetical protein [Planctomycetota bacterium]
MRTTTAFGIHAAFLCAITFGSTNARAQSSDSENAMSLFLQAERAVFDGQYAKALTLYKRIADKYPTTLAGAKAKIRTRDSAYLGQADIVRNGPSENRVDVVITGDGYMFKHQKALANLARAVPKMFERNETLGEYYAYHNFLCANVVSKDDGIDANGREYDTALGGHQSGYIQGQCNCDHKLVTQMLEEVTGNDGFAIVFVKQGVLGTGGGGIATVGGRGDKTTVHEWGHAFAGLCDEYAQTTGHRDGNRIGTNVTTDKNRIPWQHFLDKKVRGIGVYQGANGMERGAWKPVASGCVMESGERFCKVCQEALVLEIHRFVDPIDRCEPEAHYSERVSEERAREPLVLDQSLRFRVETMRPEKHAIELRWYVVPRASAPRVPFRSNMSDRRSRGKLGTLDAKPVEVRRSKSGKHEFVLAAKSLEPGEYRLYCRAIDTTEYPGDPVPWVLVDEFQLLQSERAWDITVH